MNATSRFITDADTRADGNAFTFVRLILASAVIFSHGFVLTGHASDDPTRAALPYPISSVAVFLFFSLSGFLVVGGLMRTGAVTFAISRAARLVPGLAVMLFVTAILCAGFFSDHDWRFYLSDGSIRAYVWRNLLFLGQFYSINGVYAHLPDKGIVNGSLWTIPKEVRCYAALALISMTGLLSLRSWTALAFVALTAAHCFLPDNFHGVMMPERRLAVAFSFGVLLYLWRDRVFLSWPLAVIVIAGALLLPVSEVRAVAIFLAAAYAMLVVAMLVPARIKAISSAAPDYSYGVYIYAFPVQQALVAGGHGVTAASNIVAGLGITLAFAAVSWHAVEHPALQWKSRLTANWRANRREPVGAVLSAVAEPA